MCLVDQSKTNTSGRVDEHGAFRHRHVELCAVGALAILYWVHFHVLGKRPPIFAPDYADKNFGEFGRRQWYDIYVFPSSQGDDIQMLYKSEFDVFRLADHTLTRQQIMLNVSSLFTTKTTSTSRKLHMQADHLLQQ